MVQPLGSGSAARYWCEDPEDGAGRRRFADGDGCGSLVSEKTLDDGRSSRERAAQAAKPGGRVSSSDDRGPVRGPLRAFVLRPAGSVQLTDTSLAE